MPQSYEKFLLIAAQISLKVRNFAPLLQLQLSDRMDKKKLVIIISVAAVVVIGVAVCMIMLFAKLNNKDKEIAKAQEATEQARQDLEVFKLTGEYDDLEASFTQYEGQLIMFNNDSIRAEYEKAKNRVEELSRELREQKNLSQQRIAQLQNEINTLKEILHHYVEQIDELQKENSALKEQNENLTRKTNELNNQVVRTTNENKQLSERMTLAEKLNISNVSIQALNNKDKNEKNVKKAKKLAVTFTIPQNNSTPVGTKSIFLRITSPEGNLLRDNGITFPFEGGNLEATAKIDVEYEGNEISGLRIYWVNNTALSPGMYRVELFADNYRLYSNELELK